MPEPLGDSSAEWSEDPDELRADLTFEPEFLRRLERLAIVARKTLRGVGRGERRSKRHGGTVEFADYRRYSPGDDTRRIDWYAYARLEQMFLKLYVEEQDLSLHILLDVSASMGHGGAEAPGEVSDRPSKLQKASINCAVMYVRNQIRIARCSLTGNLLSC